MGYNIIYIRYNDCPIFKSVSDSTKSQRSSREKHQCTSTRKAAPHLNFKLVSSCTLKLYYEPPHERFNILVIFVFCYYFSIEKK